MARILNESQPVSVEDVSSAEGEGVDLELLVAVVDTVVVSGPTTQITSVLRPSLSIGHLVERLRLKNYR